MLSVSFVHAFFSRCCGAVVQSVQLAVGRVPVQIRGRDIPKALKWYWLFPRYTFSSQIMKPGLNNNVTGWFVLVFYSATRCIGVSSTYNPSTCPALLRPWLLLPSRATCHLGSNAETPSEGTTRTLIMKVFGRVRHMFNPTATLLLGGRLTNTRFVGDGGLCFL